MYNHICIHIPSDSNIILIMVIGIQKKLPNVNTSVCKHILSPALGTHTHTHTYMHT